MTNVERGYECAPWELRWRGLDVDALQRTESAFALSNGHIGLRGTLEEAEPRGLPGTYLNGFYEEHGLPYAEEIIKVDVSNFGGRDSLKEAQIALGTIYATNITSDPDTGIGTKYNNNDGTDWPLGTTSKIGQLGAWEQIDRVADTVRQFFGR